MTIRELARAAATAAVALTIALAGPGRAEDAKTKIETEVGKPAPDFTLQDTEGNSHTLSEYTKNHKVVVLEWFNPECPFVKKHHQKNKTMQTTFGEFSEKEVVWLAINSGAPGKQGHGLEKNEKARESYGIGYPVLLDENGVVGRLYGAKTTPHMFVIAKDGVLLYEGAIDDNRSAGTLGETNYVASCLEAVFTDEQVEVAETKPYGCSVKYGPAPDQLP